MEQVNLAIAVSAGVVVLLGLFSNAIKRSPLSVPLLALGAGVAVGPAGLGWLAWEGWDQPHRILKEAARITLAISVTGIALRTPEGDIRATLRPVALLLSVGMLAMWAISSGLAWWVLGLPPVLAALLGAALTPTDPVVASSIVTGDAAEEKLPSGLRSTLSLESGANDGLGYLLVMLPLLALTLAPSEPLWSRWLHEVVLVGILLAVAIGAALGAAVGAMLKYAAARDLIETHSFLSLTVALSLGAVAGAKLAGSDGILAAFVAGLAFNVVVRRDEDYSEENVQEAISKLFNLPVFVLLGALLPLEGWRALGGGGLALAALVLLLRRPLTLGLLWPVMGRRVVPRDKVFLGWFAPVGVAAIYYALHGKEETGREVLWHATSMVIVLSIVAHGVTATLGMWLYKRAEGRD